MGSGSSPHVRGTHNRHNPNRLDAGIIPACAGNTGGTSGISTVFGDHPRMCGEHLQQPLLFFGGAGIIPACAGNTGRNAGNHQFARDHPRMCGEHLRITGIIFGELGSSPHVRGTLHHKPTFLSVMGIIPACAGNTFSSKVGSHELRDHPRMCGEHAECGHGACRMWGSSPHVRGTLSVSADGDGRAGIIPACAGNTRTC